MTLTQPEALREIRRDVLAYAATWGAPAYQVHRLLRLVEARVTSILDVEAHRYVEGLTAWKGTNARDARVIEHQRARIRTLERRLAQALATPAPPAVPGFSPEHTRQFSSRLLEAPVENSRTAAPSRSVATQTAVGVPLATVITWGAGAIHAKNPGIPIEVLFAGATLIQGGLQVLVGYITKGGRKGEAH